MKSNEYLADLPVSLSSTIVTTSSNISSRYSTTTAFDTSGESSYAPSLLPSMQRRGIFAQERNNPSPGLHRESITRGETRQELDEKDQMFTRQVAACFGAIKGVEDKATENKGARDQALNDKAVKNLSRRSTGTIQLISGVHTNATRRSILL